MAADLVVGAVAEQAGAVLAVEELLLAGHLHGAHALVVDVRRDGPGLEADGFAFHQPVVVQAGGRCGLPGVGGEVGHVVDRPAVPLGGVVPPGLVFPGHVEEEQQRALPRQPAEGVPGLGEVDAREETQRAAVAVRPLEARVVRRHAAEVGRRCAGRGADEDGGLGEVGDEALELARRLAGDGFAEPLQQGSDGLKALGVDRLQVGGRPRARRRAA